LAADRQVRLFGMRVIDATLLRPPPGVESPERLPALRAD
jgi:hypothetical protein